MEVVQYPGVSVVGEVGVDQSVCAAERPVQQEVLGGVLRSLTSSQVLVIH